MQKLDFAPYRAEALPAGFDEEMVRADDFQQRPAKYLPCRKLPTPRGRTVYLGTHPSRSTEARPSR